MLSAANEATYYITGLSSDTKPILKDKSNGSIFFEMDTQKVYYFDGEHLVWHEQASN